MGVWLRLCARIPVVVGSEVSLVVCVVAAVGFSGAISGFGPFFVQDFDLLLWLLLLGLWASVGDVLGGILLCCVGDRLVRRNGVGLDRGLRVGALSPLASVRGCDAVGGLLDHGLLDGWLGEVRSWRRFELIHP